MLGKTVMNKEEDQDTIYDMAGSGFESTVRLAKVLLKHGHQFCRK